MADAPRIFDRGLVARRRARAAKDFTQFDFLHRRAMEDVVDRLETVTRAFPLAHFCGAGGLSAPLTEKAGVGRIVATDLAPERVRAEPIAAAIDEEQNPFAPQSFDLVVSLLTLHAANDLIGAIAQHLATLRPDGLFIAALFGGETLADLKSALYAAEAELEGGASPRVAPFAGVRELGAALQRAGFALPVVDVDSLRVAYDDPRRLLEDLRGMGEANPLARRGRALSRPVVAAALARLPREARFDIVYLTGWAPAANQPKALKPGSATHSLADAVNAKRRD